MVPPSLDTAPSFAPLATSRVRFLLGAAAGAAAGGGGGDDTGGPVVDGGVNTAHCTFEPRAIPGSDKIIFTASGHHSQTMGSLVLLNPAVGTEGEAGGPQGRTLSIRGLFDTDTTVTLGRFQEPAAGGISGETPLWTGIGATTSFYVGITASSMYYWFAW